MLGDKLIFYLSFLIKAYKSLSFPINTTFAVAFIFYNTVLLLFSSMYFRISTIIYFLTLSCLKIYFEISKSWAAWVAQRFSTAFSPGRDPEDSGSSPMSGSLHGACFSLCLCLCLSSLCILILIFLKSLKKNNV